jgi:hypothetical protein
MPPLRSVDFRFCLWGNEGRRLGQEREDGPASDNRLGRQHWPLSRLCSTAAASKSKTRRNVHSPITNIIGARRRQAWHLRRASTGSEIRNGPHT